MTRFHGTTGSLLGAIAGLALIAATADVAQAGPFSSYAGNWSGAGKITTSNGTREALRCRAHYGVGGGGNTMQQNMTCASDSYKFNVIANVQASGSALSGTWSETSRGASGQISGSIGPTQVSATVSGVGFSASIGIASRGNRQSVTIRPSGTEITSVTVVMSKS